MGQKLSTKGKYMGVLAGVLIALGVYSWLLNGYKWTQRDYYWLPTSFLMMPFLALIITPHLQRIVNDAKFRLSLVVLLALIACAFAAFEWHNAAPPEIALDSRSWLPWHERISVQFTGVAIVVLGLGYKRKAGRFISFLSNNSLGIYCMHAFLVGVCSRAAVRFLGEYNPWFVHLVGFLVTIALAACFTEFLRRAFKHRLV
jgi:peptidoglycan/LPS O-acetylase OafA/YrhL